MGFSVIKDILMNPVYTGAIASQKKDYRFKIGTIGEKSRRTGLWWRNGMSRLLTARALTSCRTS